MAAILQNNWFVSPYDNNEITNENINIYFVCEGQNTEHWYINALINYLRNFRVKEVLNIIPVIKTGRDEGVSNPVSMVKFAHENILNREIYEFDKDIDIIIYVFDLDIYQKDDSVFKKLLKDKQKFEIFAISNPCFELFLLLHEESSYNKYISGDTDNIYKNPNISKRTKYLCKLVKDVFGANPKTNKDIGSLACRVSIAIEEEKFLNEDLENSCSLLSCNVGKVIDELFEKYFQA